MRPWYVCVLAVWLIPVSWCQAQSGCVNGHGDSSSGGSRVWGSAEYLLWWTKSASVPVPLVSTSNTNDFGTLGADSTQLLIGRETLNFSERSGGRFTLGVWLDDEQSVGVEGCYLFLGSRGAYRRASVDGVSARVIAVPFIDATPGGNFGDPATVGQENAFVFGAPVGVVTDTGFGGIAVLDVSNQLSSTEANGVFNLARSEGLRLDLLGGFRYVFFREKLRFNTSSPTVIPNVPGEFFRTSDDFNGRSDFYGGQLGTRLMAGLGNLTVSATGKLALGVTHQQLGVNGSFATNDFNTPFGTGPGQSFTGGYFALPSNIGRTQQNRFGVVPEGSLNLNYQIASGLSFSFGYTFLYLNNVIRPAEQIDRTINGGQSALYASPAPPPGFQGGPIRPTTVLRGSDFWAQGLSFGVEVSF